MKTFVALVLACSTALACSQSSPSASNASAVRADEATYETLVGKWQFVYDDARRQAVEGELAKRISDPQKLAAAKHEAEEEASASQIELTSDHVYISRIGNDELLRDPFTVAAGSDGHSLVMTRTSWLKNVGLGGITVKIVDKDAIVMVDPKKGDLLFHRAP